MVYPGDGNLIGDWKNGEKLAQSGYGGRFTDTDKTRENGGNCYACHQLAASEIAYGTLGPSLLGYGKARNTTSWNVYVSRPLRWISFPDILKGDVRPSM